MKRSSNNKGGGGGGGGRRRQNRHGLEQGQDIDYKDIQLLRHFVGERGKLLSRRIAGVSARNQREITRAIRRARRIALLPYGTD